MKSLAFYLWMDNCLFLDDFVDDLVELGAERSSVYPIVKDLYNNSNLRILKYYECVQNDEFNLSILNQYIEEQYTYYSKNN